MRVGLLKIDTNDDIPHDIDRVIQNILESDADVFVGPDNLFCGDYKTQDALGMIRYIGARTCHLGTLILPGTFTLRDKKDPVLPIIEKGKFIGLHEKYREDQPKAYVVDGRTYAISICSELEQSNPHRDGYVDFHILSTCGVYPGLVECHKKNYRAHHEGFILWTDGCRPETAVFERDGLFCVPATADILDTKIYEIDL